MLREAGDDADSLPDRMAAMQKFRIAIKKYSDAMKLTPSNYRLWSNRALCHSALKDWDLCREDALRATQLKSDFAKGWVLVAKAMWKEGSRAAALKQIEVALRLVSQPDDLLMLRETILTDVESSSRSSSKASGFALPRVSRSVSPCATPMPGSRVATPPPIRTPSRSPGPAGREPRERSQNRSRKSSTSRAGTPTKLPAMPAHVARAFAALGGEED